MLTRHNLPELRRPAEYSAVMEELDAMMGVACLREDMCEAIALSGRALLAAGDMRVYEVAQAVGIDDVKYFTRLFRQACGHTPLEKRFGEEQA